MALDEVLAQQSAGTFLRFYHWTQGPAVTFGYSQFYHFVRKQILPKQGPLCRRPTGGGIVLHGTDLTFSLIFQSTASPKEIYAALHGAIEQALAQSGALISSRQGAVTAQSYAPQQQGLASGCFANPVQDDLLVQGHKILGGAIRKFGERILYQGSLQYEDARINPAFRQAVGLGAAQLCGCKFETAPLQVEILEQARQLSSVQYQQPGWTEKL